MEIEQDEAGADGLVIINVRSSYMRNVVSVVSSDSDDKDAQQLNGILVEFEISQLLGVPQKTHTSGPRLRWW